MTDQTLFAVGGLHTSEKLVVWLPAPTDGRQITVELLEGPGTVVVEALPSIASIPGDDYLTRFQILRAEQDRIDTEILGAIKDAREAGISWSKISRALGFKSRQAAAQWYERRNGN